MMMRIFFHWALALALGLPLCTSAAQVTGRIVGVVDGDTVDLLTPTHELFRIRLSGIDAPERRQPFSDVAKKVLSGLAFDRHVVVTYSKRDRNGRLIGKVLVEGRDANLQLVRQGLAWHYKKYETEQPAEDRKAYAAAEDAARTRRLGLWAERQPMPPWDFRTAKRGRAAKGAEDATARTRPVAVPAP
jgi:endonuclease YncB( thermonuclease family)